MRQLGKAQAHAFQRGFVGRTLPVLWESARTDGLWHGLTDNYLTVVAASATALANRITQTRLVASEGEHLWGEVNLVGAS
jgi:tRNA A37 methylthiotransferase MiaB